LQWSFLFSILAISSADLIYVHYKILSFLRVTCCEQSGGCNYQCRLSEETHISKSFLAQVVDGLQDLINGGYGEQLDSIRQQLQKRVQIGVISKSFPVEVVSAIGNWLHHPIVRAVTEKSVPASSVCITQSVSVVTTEEAKLSEVILSLIIC